MPRPQPPSNRRRVPSNSGPRPRAVPRRQSFAPARTSVFAGATTLGPARASVPRERTAPADGNRDSLLSRVVAQAIVAAIHVNDDDGDDRHEDDHVNKSVTHEPRPHQTPLPGTLQGPIGYGSA